MLKMSRAGLFGLGAGVLLILAPTQSAFAFGALAVQGQNGNVGWSHDYQSKSGAREEALQECGPGCHVALDFWNGCGAYAADQDRGSTVWGTGIGRTRQEASVEATDNCESYGGNDCEIRMWACE